MARANRPARTDDDTDGVVSLDNGPTLASMEPVEFLTWQIGKMAATVNSAPASSIAYVQAVKAIRDIHAEVREAIDRDGEAADVATMTAEEWRAHNREAAAVASVDILELYVAEWLERAGYDLHVDADALTIKRRAL